MSLVDYLKELGTNQQKLDDFKANPEKASDAANLTDIEKQALLSGDPVRIRTAAGGGLGGGAGDVVVVVLILA